MKENGKSKRARGKSRWFFLVRTKPAFIGTDRIYITKKLTHYPNTAKAPLFGSDLLWKPSNLRLWNLYILPANQHGVSGNPLEQEPMQDSLDAGREDCIENLFRYVAISLK